MDSLPAEMIDYISKFLLLKDKYSFAMTNKEIYGIIWKPLDVNSIFQKLFYLEYINLYGAFFSDYSRHWIDFPFYIQCGSEKHKESIRSVDFDLGLPSFNINFYYDKGKLYVRFIKITYNSKNLNLSESEIRILTSLKKSPYKWCQEHVGSNIFMWKWLGIDKPETDKKYSEILDRIHEEICLVIKYFQANFKLVHESYYDMIYEKLLEVCDKNYTKYVKDEICSEYYFNVWIETKYMFKDFDILKRVNEEKQTKLFDELHWMLKEFHDKKLDMDGLVRLAKYFEKYYIKLL
jgi:hypothetical protein